MKKTSGGCGNMEVSAWWNGSGTYGIRVGVENRRRFFNPLWKEIEVR
jgi:hypothetical protein